MNIRPLGFLIVVYCASILCVVQFENTATSIQKKVFKTKKRKKFQEFDKPLQFISLHKEMRTPEDLKTPDYPHGYRMQELLRAKQRLGKSRDSRTKTKTTIEWTERGPGNVPGRTRALLDLSTHEANSFLAGAATGGIWKTADAGDSWSEKNDNLSSLPISSFAGDKNLNKIYAGTGEYISSIFSATGDGILVSSDLGETWQVLPATQGNPAFSIVTRIVVHPDNASLVLCTTTTSSLNADAGSSAIMRSTDGGATWQKVLTVGNPLEQIIANPENFNILYATENSVGVWKSMDAGETWSLSNEGMFPEGRIEMAISPVNTSTLFASAEGTMSGTESDLYVSMDSGESWGLVQMKINNTVVDFLGNDPSALDSQGFYDNTILCDPFNEKIVYVGGVNLFQFTLGSQSGSTDRYSIQEVNTPFLFLQSFSNISDDFGRLTVGSHADRKNVEVRFGPGKKQKAHRFLIPENKTSGVPITDYTYQDYVDVPFEVWDISTNRQLMVSFRDQNRNGVFDLVPQFLSSEGSNYLINSREYLYIQNQPYNGSAPDGFIAVTSGQEFRLMYNLFPCLSGNQTWDPENLPDAKLVIQNMSVPNFLSTTQTVADAYANFDGKNSLDQRNLEAGVHPDHHFMIPVITDIAAKTYKIILANDGGVFISNNSTSPGTTAGDWTFKGLGYNTSQFYGADKKPGYDEYIGGLQDNGTRISPKGLKASATTHYRYATGGDGFEVLWNSRSENKILSSIYYGNIYRSLDGGNSWSASTTGFAPGTDFPFLTKLAHSKDHPERIYTVSAKGVYVSDDFGSRWTLTEIPQNFVTSSVNLLDVEVSRANANIVWAGSGMGNSRNLFVSTDAGKTFQGTNNFAGSVLGSITKLASHPFEPETAYALFSFSDRPKILRTKDLGQSWEDISGFGTSAQSARGFPDVAVYSLYVRPDNPDIIWAGTEIGIVESTDNGASWAILEDFPKVSVWDMKGQDDQVVIATHGRGIWTATLAAQSNINPAPDIVTLGTAPNGKLALRINAPVPFDSTVIIVNQKKTKVVKDLEAGTFDYYLRDIPAGDFEVYLVSYQDGAPGQSVVRTVRHRDLLAIKGAHSTYFKSVADFYLSGFFLQNFPGAHTGERQNLQTVHPYQRDETYTALLKHPVKVNEELPMVFYGEVAVVEPENDFVVLEGTKNGLDWESLTGTYDATHASGWQHAFTEKQSGSRALLLDRTVDLTSIFNAEDTVLLQWRLHSGPENVSWGWAIDYISIQERPVATENFITMKAAGVFPNPALHEAKLRYSLSTPADVQIHMTNMFGAAIFGVNLGKQGEGNYEYSLKLDGLPSGTYIVMVTSNGKKEMLKLLVRK